MPPPTPAEPSFWFALAAEDAEHHAAITRLTDRVLEAEVEWFTPETRDAMRGWCTPNQLDRYWKITGAASDARALKLPVRGNFGGKDELEFAMYRAQLLVWQHAHVHGRVIHVGFIARDTDHEPRRKGAERAVESGHWPFKVVLAFPHPEIEAWSIAVFEPATKDEEARVAELARTLGFSPIERPEALTSTVAGGAADAKTVRDALAAGDAGRHAGWVDVDLEVLRWKGQRCGLAEFLDDVRRVVVREMAGRR